MQNVLRDLGEGKREWDAYWFEPIEPYPIAAFRILFGVYLLWYFLRFIGRVPLLFSNQGVYLPFLAPDYAPAPVIAWFVYAITLGAILLFIVGYHTEVITPLVLGCYLYHYFLHLAVANYSYDRLNIIFLLILSWGEVNTVWALRGGRTASNPQRVSAWTTHLLQFEVAVMYFGSGLYKALNPLWHDGKLLEMVFQGAWATPASFWIVQQDLPGWFYSGLGWAVIGFEMSVGVALYGARTRKYAILFGAAFHLGNWVLLNIPEFMSCVAAYVLFVPGAEVKKCGESVSVMCRRVLGRLCTKTR